MRLTGTKRAGQRLHDRRLSRPGEHGSRQYFYLQSTGATTTGEVSTAFAFVATTAAGTPGAVVTVFGSISHTLTVDVDTKWTVAAPALQDVPGVVLEVAFQAPPLSSTPAWTDLGGRGRSLATQRGRSYEFDRMETGTLGVILDNRDAALSPSNSQSPYAPLKSTRPLRSFLTWDKAYPLFRGITEGYPNAYPNLGYDALVELRGNDLFYLLNNSRFEPGDALLAAAMAGGVAKDTVETITVNDTRLPMPQVVPFTIEVAGVTSEWPVEEMTVTEIVSDTQYLVTRTAETTYEHPIGAAVTTKVVSFPEAYSGKRIQDVLYSLGWPTSIVTSEWPDMMMGSAWWDLDDGQTLIAPSGDLANVNPLEHINLVVDAEFGRFYVSREGRFTFKDRHAVIVEHLSAVMTFGPDDVPYVIESALEHSDEKLYNRVRITIEGGEHDGEVVDVSDAASITDHFERIFERTFPYANLNDAESAAQFVLARSAEDTIRLPTLSVQGASNPATLWPLLLAREIGDRCRFLYQPEGGGDLIDMNVVVEGISHRIEPMRHVVSFQLTEVDAINYWILGRAGYTELGTSTRVGF